MWPIFAPCAQSPKIVHGHFLLSDGKRYLSRDELLAIFESLSNVAAKLNDSHSAHEIKLFFTFTLFCALPRTINLYDFQPWYPNGIRSFIAAGANHYVATVDQTTVLKFPVVP
jgi:hypothetical protein